jgi:hypothetical protein
MRTIRMAVLLAALAITIVGCGDDTEPVDAQPAAEADQPDATADDADAGEAVTFETSSAPAPTVLSGNCNPADTADCILPTNFAATEVTGDVRGTAFGTAAVIGRNGVYPGTSLSAFTGEVEGCGSGGLLLISVGTFDATTGETTGTWTINEDGGTGELADVTGSGTSVVDASGARYEGTLSCG